MTDFVLPSKLVDERITVTFNFLGDFQWGDQIFSRTVSVEVLSGVDANPELLLYLSPKDDGGTIVTQQFQGGIPGVIYLLKCEVVTVLGDVWQRIGKLAILPSIAEIPLFVADYYTSKPYPIEVSEGLTGALAEVDGRLRLQPFPVESLTADLQMYYGELGVYLKSFEAPPESLLASLSMIGGDLGGSLVEFDAPPESLIGSFLMVSGTLEAKVIVYTAPPENLLGSLTFISGTLT